METVATTIEIRRSVTTILKHAIFNQRNATARTLFYVPHKYYGHRGHVQCAHVTGRPFAYIHLKHNSHFHLYRGAFTFIE